MLYELIEIGRSAYAGTWLVCRGSVAKCIRAQYTNPTGSYLLRKVG